MDEHRNLNASQRMLVAASFLAYEREQAKKRQIELAGTRKTDLRGNSPEGSHERGRSRDKAGARMGVDGTGVSDAPGQASSLVAYAQQNGVQIDQRLLDDIARLLKAGMPDIAIRASLLEQRRNLS